MSISRRRFFLTGATVASGFAVGYTWGIEPHWEELVERDLAVAHLPDGLVGHRLLQLSDVHVGPRVDDEYLIGALDRASRLRPDIVVVTGDLVSYRRARGDAQFAQLRAVLTHLPRGRQATLGILGNHDYGRNWSEPEVARRVVAEAERAGLRMLRNEVAGVAGLDIIGLDDLWAGQADTVRALRQRTSRAALALCHNPDGLDQLPWEGYEGWVLAGHTHGGQCKPPFLPPPILPVQNKRYTAGEIDVPGGRRLYINRGLGHLMRIRFNVRPEMTLFTLRRA